MPNKKFLVDINLNNNQLLNASLQNLATAPATAGKTPGWVYWNTTDKTTYIYTGLSAPNEWLNLGFLYSHPTFSSPVAAGDNNSLVVLESIIVNSEGHVTEFKTKNISSGVISTIINDAATASTQTWSSTYIQSKLDAINSAIAGGLVNKGGYDAIANAPNLDVTPIAGIKNGWAYTVTNAATDNTTLFFTKSVSIGDMLIANQDNPTLEAHWTIVNKNIPDILAATETIQGIAYIATQAESDAGVDDTKIITAKKLKATLDSRVGGYSAIFGDGIATSFSIAHALNTSDLLVQVKIAATGELVECYLSIDPVTPFDVTVSVNTPPTTNSMKIVIKK